MVTDCFVIFDIWALPTFGPFFSTFLVLMFLLLFIKQLMHDSS